MEKQRPVWAAKVREVLHAQGRSEGWLADQLLIDRSMFSRIMRGAQVRRAGIPIQYAHLTKQIAQLLGLPAHWLEEEGEHAKV